MTSNQCYDLAYTQAIKSLKEDFGTGLEYATRRWKAPADLLDPNRYDLENVTFEDTIEMVSENIQSELEDYFNSDQSLKDCPEDNEHPIQEDD